MTAPTNANAGVAPGAAHDTELLAKPDPATVRAPAQLVDDIVSEHKKAQETQRQSVRHAIRCGELLIQAKKSMSHGEWSQWIKDNIKLAETTARGYMRLAGLDEEKRQRVADLTLRLALKEIADKSARQQRVEYRVERDARSQPPVDAEPKRDAVDVEFVETMHPAPAPKASAPWSAGVDMSKSVGVIDVECDETKSTKKPKATPTKAKPTRPSNGLGLAKMALHNLHQITDDDTQRGAALALIRGWCDGFFVNPLSKDFGTEAPAPGATAEATGTEPQSEAAS